VHCVGEIFVGSLAWFYKVLDRAGGLEGWFVWFFCVNKAPSR